MAYVEVIIVSSKVLRKEQPLISLRQIGKSEANQITQDLEVSRHS